MKWLASAVWVLCSVSLALGDAATTASPSENKKPNIVFILADDLGWDDVEFHGASFKTPNINSLCYNGLILNRHYTSSDGSPSRAAFFSGKHPIHLGMQHGSIKGAEPRGLPLDVKILPQYLAEAGYSNYIIGKWDLGFYKRAYMPMERGFDYHFGYLQSEHDYFVHTSLSGDENMRLMGLDLRDGPQVTWDYQTHYATELFGKKAAQIIRNHDQSRPFYLHASLGTHVGSAYRPLSATKEHLDRVDNSIVDDKLRSYAAMALAFDDAVGAIVQALATYGYANNTLIVLASDNGGAADGMDGSASSNYPLRGAKRTMWEGGVRTVACVNGPMLADRHGLVSNQLMFITDWLPTLMRVAGLDPTSLPLPMDGYDMWTTWLQGAKSPRSDVLVNIDPIDNAAAYTDGEFKVIFGKQYNGQFDMWYYPRDAVSLKNMISWASEPNVSFYGEYQFAHNDMPLLVQCGEKPSDAANQCDPAVRPCLFRITDDPCEYHNLADEMIIKLNQMMQTVSEYSKTMISPANQPLDPNANPAFRGGVWDSWMDGEEILGTPPPAIEFSLPTPTTTMSTSDCFTAYPDMNCEGDVLEELQAQVPRCLLECHSRGAECRAVSFVAPQRCVLKTHVCVEGPQPTTKVNLYFIKKMQCI